MPAVVDLAAMRDAMKMLGGDPKKINPLVPVDLVIDHSVAVTFFGNNGAFKKNVDEEYRQNQERYKFLKWAQRSFDNFRVVPPGHRHLPPGQSRISFAHGLVPQGKGQGRRQGSDHGNRLSGHAGRHRLAHHDGQRPRRCSAGASAASRRRPHARPALSMVLPEVIGVKLTGKLKEGITATDLVLTVTQMLRKRGVVGKFVEFFGPGLAALSRSPTAPRSATWRRNTARPAASSRSTTTPSPTCTNTARPTDADRAGRGLCQGAGHVPHQDHARSDVHRRAQARALDGRAVARRSEASAGPRRAEGRQGRLCRRDGQGVQQGGRDEEALPGRRPQARSRPRRRGDRRDHLLHQHLESERDGRRPACWRARRPPRASTSSRG